MSNTKNTSQSVFQVVYLIFTSLFLIGVLTQVFLAGMVVVARQISWTNHVSLGHLLGLPLLVMLVSAYLGHIPRQMKHVNWLLIGVYVVQADVVIFMRSSAPLLSALHPVLALVDFALALSLLRGAWSLVRESGMTRAISTRLQNSAGD
jgi:Family of unknown function (DUF6220)